MNIHKVCVKFDYARAFLHAAFVLKFFTSQCGWFTLIFPQNWFPPKIPATKNTRTKYFDRFSREAVRLPALRSPLRPLLPRTPISPAPGPRTHISLAAPPLSDSDPLSPLPCDASLRLHSPLKVSTRFSIGSGHAALDVLAFNSPRFSRQSGRLTISGIFPTGMQSLALLNWMASRYMHPQNLISSMSPEDVTAREIVTKDNAFLAYSAF